MGKSETPDAITYNKLERQDRMNRVLNTIKNCNLLNLPCDYEKLIAETSLNFYCSRRTAKEYIDTLIAAGWLVREKNNLYTKEFFEKISNETNNQNSK